MRTADHCGNGTVSWSDCLTGCGKSRFGKKCEKQIAHNCLRSARWVAGDGFVSPKIPPISTRTDFFRSLLSSLLHRKPRFHPPLLALGIMRYVGVAHGRQFTGGVFAGMSMRVRAVGYDFSILIGQYLWCKFLDFVGRNVQGSGNVGFAVAFRGKRLNHLDALVAV